MATNKTEKYGLNQWVHSDQVLMEDFNRDNAVLDATLSGINAILDARPKIMFGSYNGKGVYGQKNPTTLTFDFDPDFVILISGEAYPAVFLMQGKTTTSYFTSSATRELTVTWGTHSVTWYNTEYAGAQYNSAVTNYYLAIKL